MKKLKDQATFKEICYKGLLIYLEKDSKKNTLQLRTVVFSEENFIPLIVRSCVEKLAHKTKVPSVLAIHEEKICVELIQTIQTDLNVDLNKVITLFAFSARSWALTLKRLAEKDLEPLFP